MAVFITGATGYIGSYVAEQLLSQHEDRLALLVRARSQGEALAKLWKAMQLHMDFQRFEQAVGDRIDLYLGDITRPDLGLDPDARARLIRSTDSVIHIAASLNRRSDRGCLDVNLRGTLEVVKLARAVSELHGLRRFSDVSTSAVCGERNAELVLEDAAVDFARRDYDPYGRTKKFCEHMVSELLPDVPISVFRPTMVLGDSRFAETTQFDMLRAFAALASMPVLPLHPDWRVDIVPANYVGRAIAQIHQMSNPAHGIYHLSAGEASHTCRELAERLRMHPLPRTTFLPGLSKGISRTLSVLAQTPREWGLSGFAGMLDVFWPYITFDTVFDNRRVVAELGEAPARFTDYGAATLEFCRRGGFTYPYKPWPVGATPQEVTSSAA